MEKISFKTLELLDDSFNYETVRLLAVSFYSKGKHLGKHLLCKFIYNIFCN